MPYAGNDKSSVKHLVLFLMGHGGVQTVFQRLLQAYQKNGGQLPSVALFAGAQGVAGGVFKAAWQTFCWARQHGDQKAIFVFGKEHFLIIWVACALLKRKNKIGFFCASHTSEHLKHKSPFKKALLTFVYRRILPTADLVIAQTPAMADDLTLQYGVHQKVIQVIPPLTDARFFEAPLPPLTGQRIASVGRLAVEKNLVDLIRAFAVLHQNNPETQLVIIGEGPQQQALKLQCAEAGIAGDVIFAGHVSDALPNLQSARLFAMTSKYEGFPLSLLEALACGCPAVVYDGFSGAKEMVRDGENGYLVPQGDVQALAVALEKTLQKTWDPAAIRASVQAYHPTKLTAQFIAALTAFSSAPDA